MRRRVFFGAATAAGLIAPGIPCADNPEMKGGMMKQSTVYFDKTGPENTGQVIDIVRERYSRGDIQAVVVASTTGATARAFKNALAKDRVKWVCVTEHAGFKGGDENLFDRGIREELTAVGIPVVQASHVLSEIGRSISRTFQGTTHVEMIAHTLRLLGQGVKVGVEISVMAADAGVISVSRDIITVAGTGSGSDTAMVLRPAHMNSFFDLAIREILAKPRL